MCHDYIETDKSQLYSILKNQIKFILTTATTIPGFVRYRSMPEFCSILNTDIVSLIFI